MTSKQVTDPNAPAADRQSGLSADELRAEQAGDLPEREAMSILDVGGLHVGLPTPGDLDGVLNTADTNLDGALNHVDGAMDGALNTGDPLDGQPALGVVDPIDGGGQIPVDHLPTDNLPIDNPPVDTLPIDTLPVHTLPVGDPPAGGGGLIGIPEQPAVPIDTETIA
jgi:hypothetical protein